MKDRHEADHIVKDIRKHFNEFMNGISFGRVDSGYLAPVAAQIVMKVFYAASIRASDKVPHQVDLPMRRTPKPTHELRELVAGQLQRWQGRRPDRRHTTTLVHRQRHCGLRVEQQRSRRQESSWSLKGHTRTTQQAICQR